MKNFGASAPWPRSGLCSGLARRRCAVDRQEVQAIVRRRIAFFYRFCILCGRLFLAPAENRSRRMPCLLPSLSRLFLHDAAVPPAETLRRVAGTSRSIRFFLPGAAQRCTDRFSGRMRFRRPNRPFQGAPAGRTTADRFFPDAADSAEPDRREEENRVIGVKAAGSVQAAALPGK